MNTLTAPAPGSGAGQHVVDLGKRPCAYKHKAIAHQNQQETPDMIATACYAADDGCCVKHGMFANAINSNAFPCVHAAGL